MAGEVGTQFAALPTFGATDTHLPPLAAQRRASAPLRPAASMPWSPRRATGASLLTTAGVGLAAGAMLPPMAASPASLSQLPAWSQVVFGTGTLLGLGTSILLAGAMLGLAAGLRRAGTTAPCIDGQREVGGRKPWYLLPAAVQGLALAPLRAQGSGVCLGPAGWAAAACVVGLTQIACRTGTQDPAPSAAELGVAAGLAVLLGPLGWDIWSGNSVLCAASRPLVFGSLFFAGRALLQVGWQLHLNYAPTPYVGRFLCDQALIDEQRLNLGGADATPVPTIFNVSPPLREAVKAMQAKRGDPNEPFKGWRGVPVLCMHGPAGTGKTLTAQGIAQALGAYLAPVSAAELAIEDVAFAPVAGLNLLTLIAEAELHGMRYGKPVLIFVDEVDAFLPTSDSNLRNPDDLNRTINLFLLQAALRFLDRTLNHVAVVFATNHVAKIQQALALVTTRVPFLLDLPTQADMENILLQKLQGVQEQLTELEILCPSLVDDGPRVQRLAERLVGAALSGRDADSLMTGSYSAVLAHHGGQGAGDYSTVFYAALERLLDCMEAAAPKHPPQQVKADQQKFADVAASPQSFRALLVSLGIETLEPNLLVSHVIAALTVGFADPGQSMRLSQVTGRASRSAYQLVARAASAWAITSERTQRDYDDVPHSRQNFGRAIHVSAKAWIAARAGRSL
jgi:hypothetical protein